MKTSLYSILCIAIRLGAVIWMVGALLNFPLSLIVASDAPHPDRAMAWLSGVVACQVILAFLFWLYPGALARWAAGRGSREVFESSLPSVQLQYVAFSIVGAWFALQGIVYLAYEVVHALQIPEGFAHTEWPAIAASSARVVFGIALMLGARGLTVLLERVRNPSRIAYVVDDDEVVTDDSPTMTPPTPSP